MANTIQIKRSATTATPPSLAVGEVAYSSNSGNLFIGEAGSVVTKIGGNTDVLKLAGIEAGAQVNTVTSVAGKTGVVTLVQGDIASLTSDLALKAPLASPTFTGTVVLPSGTSIGNVDSTELGYLDGVTSAIQTQLNGKSSTSHDHSGVYLPMGGGTLTGSLTLNADPSSALHAATKQYVDNIATGLDVKNSVRAASSADVTISAPGATIGGVTMATGNRVLLKDQGTGSQNGIYVFDTDSTPMTRAADADTSAEVTSGMYCFVEEGTHAGKGFLLTTANPITLGTTALTFAQFNGGQVYTAGTGIDISGGVVSIANHAASYVTSGTMDAARISGGTAGAFNGSAITDINGSNIGSGTVADARLSANVLLNTTTIDGGTF